MCYSLWKEIATLRNPLSAYMWLELEVYVIKRGDGLPFPFNALRYILNKRKEIGQLMLGNKQVGGKKKGFESQGLQNWLTGLSHGAEHIWASSLLSEDIWWWFAERGEPMKDTCHYFPLPGGVDGQHARARRRMRLCEEYVGPQRECKGKRWGDLCIQSISERIWRSWKADSDLELQSLPFIAEGTWISNLWTTLQTSYLCPLPFKELPLPDMPWEDAWAEAVPLGNYKYLDSRGENKVGTYNKLV